MIETPGDTDDFSRQRQQMVVRQLHSRGITDARVLAAMQAVPRELFVPTELERDAYDDSPLPIGSGQTISQPYTVAFMCEALQLKGRERVLEIGTGSGYSAAVLSQLVPHVWTVERIPELARHARARLQRLGYTNVSVRVVDAILGWPEEAPFDAIVVTAGAEQLPQVYVDQLSEGGRLVIPIGGSCGQTMYRLTRHGSDLESEELGLFSFVPLIDSRAPSDDDPSPW